MWLGKVKIGDGIIFMLIFILVFGGLFGNGNGNYMPETVMTNVEYAAVSELGKISSSQDGLIQEAIDAATADDKTSLYDYTAQVNQSIAKIYELELPDEFIPYREHVIKELQIGYDLVCALIENDFDTAKAKVDEKNEAYKEGITIFIQGLEDIGCDWERTPQGIYFSVRKAGN